MKNNRKQNIVIGTLRLVSPKSENVFHYQDIFLESDDLEIDDINSNYFPHFNMAYQSKPAITQLNLSSAKIIEGVFNDVIGNTYEINPSYEVVITIWTDKNKKS